MVKSIGRILITGFITILPVLLTIYLLYWLAVTSEKLMGVMIRWALPEGMYFPGMGMIVGVIIIFLIGLLMNAYVIRRLFAYGESILYRLPIIKSIYRAFRDFFDFFSSKQKEFGEVVSVSINGMELIGFVTQADPQRLPASFRQESSVLVYLPMSYMIGGYTLLVPRSQIKVLDMSMDEAMRFALTAGITGKRS